MKVFKGIRARLTLPPDYISEYNSINTKHNNLASSVLALLVAILVTISMLTGYLSYYYGSSAVDEFFIILPYHISCVALSLLSLICLRLLFVRGYASHYISDVVALIQTVVIIMLALLSSHTEIEATGIKNINATIIVMFSIGFFLRFNLRVTLLLETLFFIASVALLIYERNSISNYLPSMINLFASYVLACASSAMYAMVRVQAYTGAKRLETLGTYDTLTRLHNRLSFDNFIIHQWHRAADMDMTLALFFIDIDHFKSYNDTFGQAKGDKCLGMVADVISRSVRKNDFVARYGGEEFVCALMGVKRDQAQIIAAKMSHEMAKCKIAHGSSVSPYVTFSIGCMIARPKYPSEGLDDFIEKASAALVLAKNNGRNRLYIHPDSKD